MNQRDAINEILMSINELPLDVDDLVEDVQTAVIVDRELTNARRKILSQGWHFNKFSLDLYPNNESKIIIPETFFSIDGGSDNYNLVISDWKLFDKDKKTYNFTEPQTVTAIVDIEFDDIPFSVADYIVQTASLRAYINIIGNSEDISVRREEIMLSRLNALRDNARNINGNVLNNTFVTSMLDRESL